MSTPASDPPPTFRTRIAKEASRLEEDATYASKSHYNDAASWDRWHLQLGAGATVLAAAAGATAMFSNQPMVAAMVSFLSAGTAAVLTFQKPAERALTHRTAGAGYAEVRQRARQLHSVDAAGPGSDDALRQALSEIAALKARLEKESLVPSPRAFKRARAGIEDGEATHVVDARRK
jgi:hypothetical protein